MRGARGKHLKQMLFFLQCDAVRVRVCFPSGLSVANEKGE